MELLRDDIEVVDDILHVNERADLSKLHGPALQRRFLEIWTAKEAFLKALGAGLNIDPAKVAVEFGPGRAVAVRYRETWARAETREITCNGARLLTACVLTA